MVPVRSQECVGSFTSETTSVILEDSPPGDSPINVFLDGLIKEEVPDIDGTTTRISVVVVPAMGACSHTCGVVPVVVVESNILD